MMRVQPAKSRLGIFILASVCAHWLMFQKAGWTPQSVSERYTEVEVVPQKSVVQTQRVPSDTGVDTSEVFAGEFRQRVRKPTRTPLTGPLTQGHQGRPQPRTSPTELGESGRAYSLREFMPGLLGMSPNSLPEHIALGSDTVLNTDSVVYAGFLNRVVDEIYYPWIEYARGYLEMIKLSGVELAPRLYVTRLGIELDELGNLVSIKKLKGSGVDLLDEAPQRAFWDREPFKNPPVQMRKPDGSLWFVCEFHFELRSSVFAVVPWAI